MTSSHGRHARIALMAAVLSAHAVAAIALLDHFGSAFLTDRAAVEGIRPVAVAAPGARPRGRSDVMSLHEAPRPLPELRFEDGDGRPRALTAFRGKIVLLNVWATWCAPCRREMPTLDRLQAALGGPGFEVVALSIDRAGIAAVAEFYAEIGVERLAKYIDASGSAARRLDAVGLPTTLLIDREGREIARHVGPAEWDTPEMLSFLRRHLSASGN